MDKTTILRKINEVTDVKANLEKATQDASLKKRQLDELQKENITIANENKRHKSQINILVEEVQHNKSVLEDEKAKLQSKLNSSDNKAKNLKLYSALVTLLFVVISMLAINLYFFSDRLPENERDKLTASIDIEKSKSIKLEKDLSNTVGKLESLKSLIIKKDKIIDSLNIRYGSLQNKYNILQNNYSDGINCSRVPFVK